MFSPLFSFRSRLHRTHFDHVSEQTSAAQSILRADPLFLSGHSSEHCHQASSLSPFRREAYDSSSIRSFDSSSTSSTSTLLSLSQPRTRSNTNQPTRHLILHQKNKDTDKCDSVEGSDTDTMAPKSGYYDSSHSSSEGERVHNNPRREDRERSSVLSTKKRPVVVHQRGGTTGDPARKAELDGKRWK
jgi:hypothetical protein